MEQEIKKVLDAIQAPERLKRKAKAVIRKKTFDYGRDTQRQRRLRFRLLGCLAACALLCGGAGIWFWPVSSIGLEVNPSLELRINALDRVVGLKGLNSDGITLAGQLDVEGLVYDKAVQRILLSEGMQPYVEDGSLFSITVIGGNTAHAEEMLSKVVCQAYAVAGEENVLYCHTDAQTAAAAREVGLTAAQYQAWQQLLHRDPDIRAEDVRGMSGAQVRALTGPEKLEDPCDES